MKAYIEKANAESLAASSSKTMYMDCMRMLKKHCSIDFIFPKDDLKESSELMKWFTTFFTDGVGQNSFHFDKPSILPRPLKSNVHKLINTNPENLSSIYLLDGDDAQKIKDIGTLLISPVGQEVETLSNLIFEDGQYNDTIDVTQFKSWDEILPYTSPVTDIILIDSFILSDDTLYDSNLCTLFKKVCHNLRAKVNIVIFTLPANYNKIRKIEITPDFDRIRQEIKKNVESITGYTPDVTIVLSRELNEHDRTLFTNYKTFVSGDSFNYLDSQGKRITNGRYLHVSSHVYTNNYKMFRNFYTDMQQLVDKIKQKNNPDLIKGDKESNYLNF